MPHVMNLFMRGPAPGGAWRADPIWYCLLGGDPLGEGYLGSPPNKKYQMVLTASVDHRLGRFIKGGVFLSVLSGGIAGEILHISTSHHTGKLSPHPETYSLETLQSTTRLHLPMVWAPKHTTASQSNQMRTPMRFIQANFIHRWSPTALEQFATPSSQIVLLSVGSIIV